MLCGPQVRAGNVARARARFLSVIDTHPAFTMAYLSLGRLEEELGNYNGAARHYAAGARKKQPNGQLGAAQLWQS